MLRYVCNFRKKNFSKYKQSPSRRKFVQSGHPGGGIQRGPTADRILRRLRFFLSRSCRALNSQLRRKQFPFRSQQHREDSLGMEKLGRRGAAAGCQSKPPKNRKAVAFTSFATFQAKSTNPTSKNVTVCQRIKLCGRRLLWIWVCMYLPSQTFYNLQ
jgi:hypothetical protein